MLDISHRQTRTRIYDLIEKSHQSDKNISESLSDTIECKYTIVLLLTISTCFLYSGLYTQVSESINCYLNYTWKMLLANRLRRFGIFLQRGRTGGQNHQKLQIKRQGMWLLI